MENMSKEQLEIFRRNRKAAKYLSKKNPKKYEITKKSHGWYLLLLQDSKAINIITQITYKTYQSEDGLFLLSIK